MKKRNLLLAVMAALTLSGCMLNQTEEKVYKTAEELPDDPVERYKATISLCKFNGVESDVCKDSQIGIYSCESTHENIHVLFLTSREKRFGKFNYSKKIQYSELLGNNLFEISKEGCVINIESYCDNAANLHPVDDNYTLLDDNPFNHDVNGEYEKMFYINKSCGLGNIESCAYVIRRVGEIAEYYKTDYERSIVENKFIPLFNFSKSNYIKLYQTDPRALRYQRMRKEALSGNYKEAARLAYNYCMVDEDDEFCGYPEGREYNIFIRSDYLYRRIDLSKLWDRVIYQNDISNEEQYEITRKISKSFSNEEKIKMKNQYNFLRSYHSIFL